MNSMNKKFKIYCIICIFIFFQCYFIHSTGNMTSGSEWIMGQSACGVLTFDFEHAYCKDFKSKLD